MKTSRKQELENALDNFFNWSMNTAFHVPDHTDFPREQPRDAETNKWLDEQLARTSNLTSAVDIYALAGSIAVELNDPQGVEAVLAWGVMTRIHGVNESDLITIVDSTMNLSDRAKELILSWIDRSDIPEDIPDLTPHGMTRMMAPHAYPTSLTGEVIRALLGSATAEDFAILDGRLSDLQKESLSISLTTAGLKDPFGFMSIELLKQWYFL